MLPVKRLIPVAILLLVIVSGSLLGMSLRSPLVVLIAVIGAALGYCLTDFWKLFRIDGWVANLASVGILVLAMKDFWPEDSTGKLISVANLLVYLQTVLMFQEKTARLVWQVLVLSLLQVVVAAIFSLEIEGGILFLFYFLIAGLTMMLQAIYVENSDTVRRNQSAVARLLVDTNRVQAEPILFFDPEQQSSKKFLPLLRVLLLWMCVTSLFTGVMFYLVPRHTQPWLGASRVDVASTGVSKAVDLTNRNEIRQSNELIFRASFESYGPKSRQLTINDLPYFRGMALSSLVVENGKTNWRAPHDRVYSDVYQALRPAYPGRNNVRQFITLEPTIDPLIYSTMPVFRRDNSRDPVEFCHEISALTRCRVNEKIDFTPFKYELGTCLNERGQFFQAWPFISNTLEYRQSPMSEDPPEQAWLTAHDPSMYPTVVNLAAQIVIKTKDKKPAASRLEIVRALESYFQEPGRFRYTLDFRNVRWTDKLDPIEDFVRNHRSGHCELFASALTIMLRSQGIPARLVVGFHGGEYSQITNSLMVRGKHAHAWVEAYLRPEDCSDEMLERGEAGPGGAWLLVDPTPPVSTTESATVSAEAIELARTMWQDYVVGVEAEPTNTTETFAMPYSIVQIIQNMDIELWKHRWDDMKRSSWLPWLRFCLPFLIVLPFLISWLMSRFFSKDHPSVTRRPPAGVFRRMVAGALSLIAPGLSQWVLEGYTDRNSSTLFYDRMLGILETLGYCRTPQQSPREFARQVSLAFADHSASSLIDSTVTEVTEIFQQIRFGRQPIDVELREQIELSLSELATRLRAPSR